MNRQAKLLLLLSLALLAVLSATGAGAMGTDAPAARPAQTDEMPEGAMPPLGVGALKAPERLLLRPSGPAGQPSTDFQSSADAPVISIWYGAVQQFGAKGDPQKWINILGSVASATPITSLTYSLNGGAPVVLNLGADNMRLASQGDFNIELDYTDLLAGNNQVVITALDSAFASSQAVVTVQYSAAPAWTPQTYTVNWGAAAKLTDVAQVVDGQWIIDSGAARPTVIEFDRLLAIGDLSWKDYTVSVPITILGIDPSGYQAPSNGPGVGVMVRWQGHFMAENDTQPRTGWRRLGALGWYRWKSNPTSEGLQLLGHRGFVLGESTRTLNLNTTYIFKISVESNANPSKPSMYRFKVWEAAQAEPAAWDFEKQGIDREPRSGSILLLAHHVDARFGNVTVNLNSVLPQPQLKLSATGTGTGSIQAAPDKGTYRFGEDVTLTAVPGANSTFLNWLGDLSGTANPAALEMFEDRTVAAVFTNPAVQTPISDDFSGCALNSQRWTFINPVGDATVEMTGSQVQINVPEGAGHDIWTGGVNAPRIMQYAQNGDFEFDVKFESAMSKKNQAQGLLIQGDAQNFLRYNFLHDGDTYRIQAYTFLLGQPTERINQAITIAPPMYLRAKRVGNVWNLYYSGNGTSWTFAAGFQYDLVVSSYGPYVGNSSKNPAMVGQIDYFFNTKSPINPEDTDRKLNIATQPANGGTVTRSPIKDNYACDEQVTLTPVPNPGFKFDSWSGDLTGDTNPATLTMNGTKTVTANFVADVQYTVSVSANGFGTVVKSPDKPFYSQGESVTLTATPNVGNLFTGWSGDVVGTTNPVTVQVTQNMTVAGNFATAPPRILTVNVNGSGGVIKNPDKATYLNGESVTLTAIPGANHSFTGWSGDATGTAAQVVVVMDGDKSVTASFAENVYTLTVTSGGNGTVTKNPDKAAYYDGEQVTLTPAPAPGYKFAAWSGDLTGSDDPATVTMTGNKTVNATFIPAEGFSVNVSVVGSGSVTKSPDKAEYDYGEQVTLTAIPGAGAEFLGWSGGLTGAQNPATVTVTGDVNITATFGAVGVYTLTVLPPSNGAVQVNPVRALYAPGEQVTLTAVPSLGYIFDSWSGHATGNNNPYILTMDGNKTVSATFVTAPVYTVNVTSAGNGSVAVDPPGTQFTAGTQITLTATADEGFVFEGWSGDLVSSKNPYVLTVDGNKNIVAAFTDAAGPVSDDFDGCGVLDPVWTWVDPLGQADYTLTGSQVKITIPPDANYEVWRNGNNGARLLQEVANTDFAVTMKVESSVTQAYQLQGILIEAEEDQFIRIDFYHDGESLRFFAGRVENGAPRIYKNVVIPDPASEMYMLVRRTGDRWQLYYGYQPGGPWTSVGSFNYSIHVQRVGLFAGSHPATGATAPGHTAVFDYFFNYATPIAPEDANAPGINVTITGQGAVQRTPDSAAYTCGQQVELRAKAAAGWRFQNWSGDLNGTGPTQVLTVNRKHNVTATFIQLTGYRLYLPATIR